MSVVLVSPIIKNHEYGLCPERNSWEEFVMLSSLITKIRRAIELEEHDQQTKKRLKRKRKRSDSMDSNSDDNTSDEDDSEEREIKRLKKIEKKLKRKYQEMLYG